MNFRVFAAGLMFLTLFQILVAAGVVLYVVHCEAPRGATEAHGPVGGPYR